MQALAYFRIFIRLKVRADAFVHRLPRLAIVVGAKAARRGDPGIYPLRTRRIAEDRMHHHSAASGIPFVARRMLREPCDFIPFFSAVIAAEKRARIGATPQSLRSARTVRLYTPDTRQVQAAVFRKFDPL